MQYAVIVAGGRGLRMQAELPKQFLELCGMPVLMHTIHAFARAMDSESKIILVLPNKQIKIWRNLCNQHPFRIPHEIISGGQTRFESVKNGLEACKESSVIAIHDGVRPLISESLIKSCFKHAAQYGSALPVVPIAESLRKRTESGSLAINRDGVLAVQTPQCFQSELIKQAYKKDFSPAFTDDATVFEASGNSIELVDGDPINLKITTPVDMKIAEAIIGMPSHR